jgi:2-polyprenyl-3-methyl-5-hydroxy-6-metoxy-1,4-benzoquinol methylase
VSLKEHWDSIYSEKTPATVSWFQPRPTIPLELIQRVARRDAAIIDVGGGASTLVDALLASGYTRVTVADLAASALRHSQARLGEAAARVEWRCADILDDTLPAAAFDVWHDRAVFHFLTSSADRQRYVEQVARAVKPNGYVIVSTFAEDGPERCSGLEVVRYSSEALHAEFGQRFELVQKRREEHVTPAGSIQAFQYCLCVYRPAILAAV